MTESVGAIWKRASKKDGKEYLSISFTHPDGKKSEFIAFVNDKDGNDKRPDYKIYKSLPIGQRPTQSSPPVAPPRGNSTGAANPAIPNQGRPSTVPFDDDVPF
jgi:uncharacterized protein (DUF736 family)